MFPSESEFILILRVILPHYYILIHLDEVVFVLSYRIHFAISSPIIFVYSINSNKLFFSKTDNLHYVPNHLS